jgi:uncharacterized membrane protein
MSKPALPNVPTRQCAITGATLPMDELTPLALLRPQMAGRIQADHPDLPRDALLSHAIVAEYRGRTVEELLREERGEITRLEQDVIDSLARHETVARNVDTIAADRRTLGDRWADTVAEFGGSWTFIGIFAGVLVVWMAVNIAEGAARAFDPYPFILLNLVLSSLAAVQAPVIMMSQRRQESKDRLRAQNDYQVNLKAELEIRHLHEKLDHILTRQWDRLAEIQRIQIELLEELSDAGRRRP